MNKRFKTLIIAISVIIGILIAATLILHFSSPKYIIENDSIERVYIYHNELEREIYEFTDEELFELRNIFSHISIREPVTDNYEEYTGGPWFSFFCEMKNGRTIQLYAVGQYLHINSVPFVIDDASSKKLADLHSSIEDKFLPLDPDLVDEIMNKR